MGSLGSDYFAEYPTVPIESIVANLNLDGLSLLYPLREIVPFGAEHSTLDATVRQAAQKMGIALAPDPFPQEVFFVRSDQYSFVRRGVPSLFLFMGLKSDWGSTRRPAFGSGSPNAITPRRTTSASRWTSRPEPVMRSSTR